MKIQDSVRDVLFYEMLVDTSPETSQVDEMTLTVSSVYDGPPKPVTVRLHKGVAYKVFRALLAALEAEGHGPK